MAMKIDYNPIVDAINSRLKRATKLQNCNFKPGKKCHSSRGKYKSFFRDLEDYFYTQFNGVPLKSFYTVNPPSHLRA